MTIIRRKLRDNRFSKQGIKTVTITLFFSSRSSRKDRTSYIEAWKTQKRGVSRRSRDENTASEMKNTRSEIDKRLNAMEEKVN